MADNDTKHSGRVHGGSKSGRRETVPRGYAYPPGTGPEGETCGTCVFRDASKNYNGNKHWSKCWLVRSRWTGGRGTDILVKSKACKYWRAIPAELSEMWKKLRDMMKNDAPWVARRTLRAAAEDLEKKARE